MNNGNTPNNLNLPPVAEQLPPLVATPETGNRQAEVRPAAAPELTTSPSAAVPASIPLITPVKVTHTDASGTTTTAPAIADDNDLIEKEWVLKAKEIAQKTKDNPYVQNKEMNVFKADYMKKRYNKTMKLSE